MTKVAGFLLSFLAVPGDLPDRYRAAVFESVDITRDIVYREAWDFTGKNVKLRLDLLGPRGRIRQPVLTGVVRRSPISATASPSARHGGRRAVSSQ